MMTRFAQNVPLADAIPSAPSQEPPAAPALLRERLRRGGNSAALVACLLFPLMGTHVESAGAQTGAAAAGWRQPVRQAIDAGRFDDAAKLLRPAVQAGDAAAMTELAILHHFGIGVREDDNEAYRLFKRAAGRGESTAMFWLGKMNLLGYGPPRTSPDAERDAAIWFFEGAQRGHAESQYYLGLLFMAGTGVEKDPAEADKWIRRAAAAGHEPARKFVEGSGRTPAK